MVKQYQITLKPRPKGFHLITGEVLSAVGELPETGIMHVFIKHTSAGLAINENADPSVRHDLNKAFDYLAPENQPFYTHTLEGDDDMPAHIKTAIVGTSLSIPITNGKLNLGTWQGIYLCEFRKFAGSRKLVITIYY